MSMLAEPRRKQKWSLNPRGKHWSEDSNKFGQKMLEKMGWSSGKGLGANEQGATEHVRVSLKNDTAGFGYSIDKQDQAWTEQQEDFNDLLQKLQGNLESTTTQMPKNPVDALSGTSLEEKSKLSRARVHYQKFTRGKDVNKYSTKDLANIFGQKDLNEKVVKSGPTEEYVPDALGSVDKTGGIYTVNSGSITDYFMKKDVSPMKPGKNQHKTTINNNSDSETEKYVGFGFNSSNTSKERDSKKSSTGSDYAFDNPCLHVNGTTEASSPAIKRKPSKKWKKEFVFENGGLDLDDCEESAKSKISKNTFTSDEDGTLGFVNDALNLNSQTDETRNGKEFEVSRPQFGLSNNGLDITDETTDKKRVTFNGHVEYSTSPTAKKKKITLDKFEVETGKRKKKRKREEYEDSSTSMSFANPALDFDCVSEEVNDNKANERKIKKAKWKKEKKMTNLETIQEAVDEDKEAQANVCTETITLDESMEECMVITSEITNGGVSMKTKKKKKKKEKEKNKTEKAANIIVIDIGSNPEVINLDDSTNYIDADQDNVEVEVPVKKNKKNKHRKVVDKSKSSVTNDSKEEQTITLDDDPVQENGIKQKKKHKKSSRKIAEILEERTCNEELIDNQESVDDSIETKLPKKRKKSKKDKDKLESQVNSSNANETNANEEHIKGKQEHFEGQVENRWSPWRKNKEVNGNKANGNRSPWTEKTKMSKRMLRTMFHKNLIDDFPGVNVHDIKGYAADIGCNV